MELKKEYYQSNQKLHIEVIAENTVVPTNGWAVCGHDLANENALRNDRLAICLDLANQSFRLAHGLRGERGVSQVGAKSLAVV